MAQLKIFIIAFLAFLITDSLWLGFIAKNLYFEQYASWLNLVNGQLKFVWWSALFVYLLFAFSIVVFIAPLADDKLLLAAGYGAALGLLVYGVYDFTCLAIFRNWPVGMAFVDLLWGTFLYAWSSFITLWLSRAI